MTLPPDFDQLVGADVEAAERARLQRVHALLVQAGPPAELSPELEAPALGLTLGRRSGARPMRRGVLLLAAAISILALAFVGGYIAGNGGGSGAASGKLLKLTGTPAAPSALASLQLEPVDTAGNWPMRLTVTGLPKLHGRSYYEVFLVRDGKPYAPCGGFKVASGRATTVDLNAPYRLKHGDTWVVTLQVPDTRRPGTVVMKPATV